MPKTLAITGATGFVGSAAVDAALDAGFGVRALTRRDQPEREGVTWVKGTLDDEAALGDLVKGVDAVLHIAGLTNTPDPQEFARANVIGTAAAYLLATARLGFSGPGYLDVTWQAFTWSDLSLGLTKAAVFGFLIALISTYQGYRSAGGAQGVGQATRQAVVLSSIAILAANYLITDLFFAS